MKRGLLAAVIVWLGISCGGGSSSPTAPAAPTIANAAGVWVGNVTQTSATSSTGECATLYQLSNGLSDRFTASITQSSTTLTATASSQTSGSSCAYSGTAGTNNITLNATSCTVNFMQGTCNGFARDMYLAARSVTGTVSGNTMTGTVGETWNVFVRGTTANGIGIVTVTNSFSFTR